MTSRDEGEALASWVVRVRGRVQGVGFRDACVHQARSLGITGWVRNRIDESVEAMLQGAPELLEAMCDWLRDGANPGLVEALEVTKMKPPLPRFDRFDRLPTR